MVSRRKFIRTLGGTVGVFTIGPQLLRHISEPTEPEARSNNVRDSAAIDRLALVQRHNPRLKKVEPLAPLSVGNGEFAFTVDVTGLQTIAAEYEESVPLCTMSQWGWHSAPATFSNNELRLVKYNSHGRDVGYQTSPDGQSDLYNWLRENPHRLHLGRVSLYRASDSESEIDSGDLTNIDQELDLAHGFIASRFDLDGVPVVVKTAVHPSLDLLAVQIDSELVKRKQLGVRVTFPYGSPSMAAANWLQPHQHRTEILKQSENVTHLARTLDAERYFVSLMSAEGRCERTRAHTFVLTPRDESGRLQFVLYFSSRTAGPALPTALATFESSADHWKRFWTTGGAVELSESRDSRAHELERRVVLSQYLTAIQCAGSLPPQETGLTVNSWYGKFHLEMHWWHATHFALWHRLPLFEKSLNWYQEILPAAQKLARSQGYSGARWPKMVGPEGRDSPSPIGPLLIWQQPHPIFYAELCYQSNRSVAMLSRYQDIVFESASFMASYAFFESKANRYVLGPPLIPAQENHPPNETWNPTFELAYWKYGLTLAQEWRRRLGKSPVKDWQSVATKISALPVKDGAYLAHENCPQTYTERNRDHPSMLGAYGFLPGEMADRETMRRTLHKTLKEWQWDETWGWDYPLTALTAARLDESKTAIDALLMSTAKNRYLINGHNWQRQNLPCYLPGNGGLLYAIAMMAAGWKDGPTRHAPGFPTDGSWTVKWEGLNDSLAGKF
jgi:protein-glucosylgalactosylhydroxylysine glucosidase